MAVEDPYPTVFSLLCLLGLFILWLVSPHSADFPVRDAPRGLAELLR